MCEIIVKKRFFLVGLLYYLCCSSCSYLPENFEPSTEISIIESEKYIEINNEQRASTGIIFYPGGLVDAHAYIPLFSNEMILNKAVKSIIVKMPLNLAVFDANEAKNVINKYTEIDKWFIAGHSLGGAMACTAVNNSKDIFDGMILLAAYPSNNVNLSEWDGKVLSLRGSNDLLTTEKDIEDTIDRLPSATEYFTIEGGNHASFGQYGAQNKDGENELNSPSQIEITVKKMINFIL